MVFDPLNNFFEGETFNVTDIRFPSFQFQHYWKFKNKKFHENTKHVLYGIYLYRMNVESTLKT